MPAPTAEERAQLTKARQARLIERLIEECSADPKFHGLVTGKLRMLSSPARGNRSLASLIADLERLDVAPTAATRVAAEAFGLSERQVYRRKKSKLPR